VIQDYNPQGGPSVTPDFIARLNREHPHFRYIKLEEPMMAGKVKAILDATSGAVGVIEGWGGMYMLELIPAGICGVMPGLGLTDLLARIFELCVEGRRTEAFNIFAGVLPQILYSLQNMELFHHAEKMLLESRGVLPGATVREATLALGSYDREHIRFLNSTVLALLDSVGLARNPAPARQIA
jgi:4-hydroxy-tetrahydrodipicolinate synthase